MSLKSKKLIPLPALLKKAQKTVNDYIRRRDEGKPCISCGSYNTAHASHFYPAGHYTGLRFNLDNIHASCIKCNVWLHGNTHGYRQGLLERIGEDKLKKLDIAANTNRYRKWQRFELEAIIETYKLKSNV